MTENSPVNDYLAAVRAIKKTGAGTGETSYYPALSQLFDPLGGQASARPLVTVSQVSVKDTQTGTSMFPDFGFIDKRSRITVLPVEVKPATDSLTSLAVSRQTEKYARRYGGKVLVTNLWQFALAETGRSGKVTISEGRIVSLAESADEFFSRKKLYDLDKIWDDLSDLVRRGSMQEGSLHSPEEVAELLAYHARKMADAINSAPGNPDELLQDIRHILSEGLQVELSGEHLVPTVVQTLIYGVFAAWLDSDDPDGFEWMRSSYTVTVPVFAEILHEALKPRLLRVCDLTSHLDDIQMVLRWTDKKHFSKDFDGDAIQYFYEPFLAQFDATLRKDLGVWYTPREIADYQITRTHHHIVNSLGVPDGLASNDVYVLDPATGTGTYLISSFDFLREYFKQTGETDLQAARNARDAVLSRFIGFEVLPAAFIICHLHLSRQMKLAGADPQDARLRIYLTNSLTGWQEDTAPDVDNLLPELTAELRSAAEVKHTTPIVAVVGNPPWEGYSTAETVEEKKLILPIASATRNKWAVRKHRLNDLYVRFWLVAIHRIVNITGRGVVSLITNRSWVGGRSYPALREHVVSSFNEVWVDDLHGGVHDQSTAGDQSIFTTKISGGIRVGTAIVTAVKHANIEDKIADVNVSSYRGKASSKRAQLTSRKLDGFDSGYERVETSTQSRFRFVKPEEYDGPAVDEYLDFFVSGVQTVRDELVTDFDPASLKERMRDFYDPKLTLDQVAELHPDAVSMRGNVDKVRSKLINLADESRFDSRSITPFTARAFDRRYLYWETEGKLLNRARPTLRPYAAVHNQVFLVIPQATRRVGAARPVPSRALPSYYVSDPDARVFPLYRPEGESLDSSGTEFGSLFDAAPGQGSTMVSVEWERSAAHVLGTDDLVSAGEAVFFSLIAITHSPKWLACQPVEFDDFPMASIPGDPEALAASAIIGRTLVDLYDLDAEVPGVTKGTAHTPLRPGITGLGDYDDVGDKTVQVEGRAGFRGGRRGDNGDVYWSGNSGWRNIPDAVWEFTAGGFQILPKWLSYRTLGGIDELGRAEFRSICRRIHAVKELEAQCDLLFERTVEQPLEPMA